jgi:hypothetical protein
MDKLTYNTKTYQGPANWKECSPEMIEKLIVFSRIPSKDITDEIYEMAIQIIFSITPKAWALWRMTAAEWKMLKDQIRWVFKAPQVRPFASFHHLGFEYLLFEENFANTTALELSVAMIAFTDFVDPDEPDKTALDRLIATLCRPIRKDLKDFEKSDDWTGDNRETFNETRMMNRADQLATLSMDTKVVMLTYFEVQVKSFLEQYEALFGGDTEPRYGDGRGWIMLLKNIAKEGHFGNFDQVGKQYAHLVYAAALDDTINALEMSRNQEENEY